MSAPALDPRRDRRQVLFVRTLPANRDVSLRAFLCSAVTCIAPARTNPDVVGIDVGITLLAAEKLRT